MSHTATQRQQPPPPPSALPPQLSLRTRPPFQLFESPTTKPHSMAAAAGRPRSERQTSSSSSSSSSSTSPHSISPVSPSLAPKVQLVPYARTASFDVAFSDAERELLNKANFDAQDLSSQDFDFEDIFTYDKPQKKLSKVVEVSTPTREYRDWSNFSFSHYSAAVTARNRVNKPRPGIGELYLKNQTDSRKALG